MCIDKVAQHPRQKNRDDAERYCDQIMLGDILHPRFQVQQRQRPGNYQPAQRQENHCQPEGPIESLLDDKAYPILATGTIELRDCRCQSRDNTKKTAEERHEQIDPDGYTREVLLTDMSGHDGIEKPSCHKGQLGNEYWQEHGKELPCLLSVVKGLLH